MDTIAEIKEIPIIKAITHLTLKRRGKLYQCFNPNHEDKNYSLSVHETENYFYCFGCGIGGDIIKLYQVFYNVDFKSAVKRLAAEFNVQIKSFTQRTNIRSKSEFARMKKSEVKQYNFLCKNDEYLFDERAGIYEYEANYTQEESESLAMDYIKVVRLQQNKIIFQELYNFCISAFNEEIEDRLLRYLVDERKLSEYVIKDKKIFSLYNYTAVNKYLISKFDIQDLNGSGLFKNGKLIFKDSHRLIIPYLENGCIVYLRARYFNNNGDTNTDGMKYYGLCNDDTNLNTVKRFYNIDILLNLKIYDKLFICEGEIDAIALETLGLNAIAIPGVNSIPEHQLINLIDFNISLALDNDLSGQRTSEKLVGMFHSFGKQISIIEFPAGIKDASEFLLNELNKNQKAGNKGNCQL